MSLTKTTRIRPVQTVCRTRSASRRGVSMALCLGVAAGCLLGLSSTARAMPEVLKTLPENAAIVVTIPSPKTMEKNLKDFAAATDAPIPPIGIADVLGMGGFVQGVAADQAMALVVMPPADPKAEFNPETGEGVVVLMPTTAYADLLANFEGKPTGGVDELQSPDGEKMFARDLKNGYALIGQHKATLESYTPGKADAISPRAGKAGMSLIDGSDFVTIVNIDVLRPHMAEAIKKAKEEAKEAMENMPMPGQAGAGEDALKQLDSPLAKWVEERLSQDTRMVVGGIKFSPMGVKLDLSSSFVEGSYLGKVFSSNAAAGALLKNLPNEPYLLALALDTSSSGLKTFLADFAKKAKESAPTGDDEMPQLMVGPAMEKADGQAALVGFNPMMLMGGGALSSTISYTKGSKPDEIVADVKKALADVDGFDNEMMSVASKYKDAGATIGAAKTPVDTWEMKLTPKNADPEAAQMMAMVFGPAGKPSGYVAKADGGVYMTYANNSQLLEKAMAASKGDANLAKDAMIMQVGELLPANRFAEAYIGTKSILDTVVPMMGMMGVQMDPSSIPTEMPPLAASISNQQGSAQFTFFVPSTVIKVGSMVSAKFQEAAAEMGGMGEEDGMEGDGTDNQEDGGNSKGKPTGQPSF